VTASHEKRPLISVSELQRFSKEKGEALIMHARQYPIITEIADIDQYEMFRNKAPAKMERTELPEVEVFSAEDLLQAVIGGDRPVPFSETKKKTKKRKTVRLRKEDSSDIDDIIDILMADDDYETDDDTDSGDNDSDEA
jgi:hypothetical protein